MKIRSYLALCAATVAMPALAQTSEKRLSADVAGTLGYANNPFATTGSDTGAAFAAVDIRPQLRILRENSTLTISAQANVQQYFNRYNRSDNYSGGLDYAFRPTEHSNAHLFANVQSSLIGSTNDVSNQFATVTPIDTTTTVTPTVGLVPITPINALPVNAGTDIALFGTGARRRTINGGGDITAVLSARDIVTASAFVVDSRFSNTGATDSTIGAFGDYFGYGGTVGYSRQLSEYVQAGLQGSVGRYDYTIVGGDTTVYSIQATTSARINTYWQLNGAVGVSFVNREIGGSEAAVSGSLSLCRRGIRSVYCLNANRAVQPTGSLGTQISTSAGGSYSYRLTERSNIGASADYSRNSNPTGLGDLANTLGTSNEFVRTSVTYDRQLRQRLRFIASASYRKIFGGNLDRPSDFGGQVGLAIRLGDIR